MGEVRQACDLLARRGFALLDRLRGEEGDLEEAIAAVATRSDDWVCLLAAIVQWSCGTDDDQRVSEFVAEMAARYLNE